MKMILLTTQKQPQKTLRKFCRKNQKQLKRKLTQKPTNFKRNPENTVMSHGVFCTYSC